MQIINEAKHPILAWVDGVEFDDKTRQQVLNMASLPFIHDHIALMPDCHYGVGATVGSVVPTINAIVPACVGVDLSCGMSYQRTSLRQENLPDDLGTIRSAIERTIPVGFKDHGDHVPSSVESLWKNLDQGLKYILDKYPKLSNKNPMLQLGTLGGGNHFIELTVDTQGFLGIMLHSGSRGIGNRIGTFFISKAKEEMIKVGIGLVDKDLAYLTHNTSSFNDYIQAMEWASDYAFLNRRNMMDRILHVLRTNLPSFELTEKIISCHHNYVAKEHHFGQDVFITRKGAIRAGIGELGIIPSSMGAKSFIVRGKGNPDSFESCSHGAGRRMGRKEAKHQITLDEFKDQTLGIECRKDSDVIDEAPGAYKDIMKVMKAQEDLVDIIYEIKQLVCVKG